MSEWRDHDFGLPGGNADLGVDTGGRGQPKPICLLPFPFDDVLLQGETKQLRLYEDRFIQLFQDVMENQFGMCAMGLLAQSGVIQTVPLCEVEASNTMEEFGIFVTLRVVGRAQLLELSQKEPYLKATCMEITDHFPPSLELPNVLADNIETTLLTLSSMEHRFNQEASNKLEDEEMERRIAIAKLEDSFYMSQEDKDDDDKSLDIVDDDDDDDDDDEVDTYLDLDRLGRFRQAFAISLASDTQGYRITSNSNNDNNGDLSPRELMAVSWAAFCTELVPSEEATYRIQAMDADHLFERLKLALFYLKEKKAQLEEKMTKAGIRTEDIKSDDNNNSDDDDKDSNNSL